MTKKRERWLAWAMALWMATVTTAFLLANKGYLLAKLIERGVLQ